MKPARLARRHIHQLWKYENVESIPVDSRYKLDNEADDCRYLGIYDMYHEANTSTVRLSIPEYSNISGSRK